MAPTSIGNPVGRLTLRTGMVPTTVWDASPFKSGDMVRVVGTNGPAKAYTGLTGKLTIPTGGGWWGCVIDEVEVKLQWRSLENMLPGPPPPLPSPQPTRRSLFDDDLGSDLDELVNTMDTEDFDTVDFSDTVDNFSCSLPADAADAADATGIGAMVNMTVPAPSPNVQNVPLPFSPEAVAPIVQISPAAPNIGNKLGAAAGLYSPPTAPPPTSAALTIPSPNNSSSSGSGTFTHFDQRSDDFLNRMLYIAERQLAGSRDGL